MGHRHRPQILRTRLEFRLLVLPALYPILDTAALAARNCAVENAADALLEAGAGILQFRHKGPFTRGVFSTAERIAEMCRQAGAIYVIDDRAEIALALNAGVHLGQDDLPPRDARRIVGPRRVIGFSTHNEEQLRSAADEPADYIALGPIFATGSRENPDPALGIEELRRLRPLSERPLVAIGGITLETAGAVRAAGADSAALIGALLPDPCTKAGIRRRAEVLLAATSRGCHNFHA